ncbi:hypothetical protein NTGHW29_140065 [Candidatus Nitrotoga sp. HW29]|nr:hypothetical protein NTGHW29_140065 [Candidatus Nitrotoga sp. HW29]
MLGKIVKSHIAYEQLLFIHFSLTTAGVLDINLRTLPSTLYRLRWRQIFQ